MTQKLIQRIDARLERIAKVLLLNASFINNLGLLNGKMGISIFFFRYGKYTNNEIYTTYAGELIDEIYEELNTQTPIDFANGFTGIGWGIEYLVQNGFVEADTDEALEDMDTNIYNNKQNRPILIEHSNDLFGFGHYYLARLRGHENDDDNLNTLLKKQNLIFLTDECERLLVHKRFLDYNIPVLKLATLNSIAYFLIEMDKLGLFPSKIENLFRYLPSYFEFSVHQADDWAEKETSLKLLHSIQSIVSEVELQRHYAALAKKLTVEQHDATEETMVDGFIKSAWHLMVYAPYSSIGNINKADLTEKVLSYFDNEVHWNLLLDSLDANNMGLTGFAGIGLGLLMNERCKNEGMKEESTPKSSFLPQRHEDSKLH